MCRSRLVTVISPRRSAIANLRCAYFSQAGDSAARYHISFDRILTHLWDARQVNRRLLLRSVACIDDLVHAVACVDDNGLAWADLAERYERALIRRCRNHQDEIGSMMLVRRMYADLRRRSRETCSLHTPTLRSYAGTKPLRNWLADRLSAARTREALSQPWRTPARTCSGRLPKLAATDRTMQLVLTQPPSDMASIGR